MNYNFEIENRRFGGNSIDEILQQLDKVILMDDYIGLVGSIKDSIQNLTPDIPIIFEEDDRLNVMARLEYGLHHKVPFNKIVYRPSFKYWLHAVVHELMHLEMYTKATLCNRGFIFKKGLDNEIYFTRQFGIAFEKLIPRLGSDKVPQLKRIVQDGIITQLISCPLDLFVEKHIFDRYKELSLLQLSSLLYQERININQYLDSSVSLMPPKIVSVNKILCMTVALQFKEFYGVDLLPLYNSTKKENDFALDFYDEYKAYLETFNDGDEYELYDYFSDNLKINGVVNKLKE